MRKFYQTRETLQIIFTSLSLLLVGSFLYISDSLMRTLAAEEKNKMEIWAEATRSLASNESQGDMNLVLKVIQGNTSIPVIILDDKDQLLWHLNLDIPSRDTLQFISREIEALKQKNNRIEIHVSDNIRQYLYYEDSKLLKQLAYFPYLQVFILMLFILIAYWALESTRKAEQNQIWAGLSKETAHQLATPISSLMAWIEYLKDNGTNKEIVDEMQKDIVRLTTITDRFSKIGSSPSLEVADIRSVLSKAVGYMQRRVSSRCKIVTDLPEEIMGRISVPLFEWVIENLIKNAVDATEGAGVIRIRATVENDKIIIEIQDNGKGIPKKHFNAIFRPGFTTKKRGWGLGLSLSRRIITEYHYGRIYVRESRPDVSTVIRIELPLYTDISIKEKC